jgi:hypothetical protein
MQLDLVVMVRNEADVWAEFLAKACPMFDRITVIDHQSTDGTSETTQEFIKQGAPLKVYRYAHHGFIQRELSNAFARHCFERGADWVFILDADEFLEVPDRKMLEESLDASRTGLVSFGWKNLAPTEFGSFTSFDMRQEFLWTGVCSRFGKVAISKSFASKFPNFYIQQGNHDVSPTINSDSMPTENIGSIFHIPIRSAERFRHKLEKSVAAYKKLRLGRHDTFQWFELYPRRDAIDAQMLRGIAMRYGEPIEDARPVDPTTKNSPRVRLPKPPKAITSMKQPFSYEETTRRDLNATWDDGRILLRAGIFVSIDGDSVKISNQPLWRSTPKALTGQARRIKKAIVRRLK